MSSGHGTVYGYRIQVRSTASLPGHALPRVGVVSVGPEWVTVPVDRQSVLPGVPTGLHSQEAEALTDLLSYPAACSLMAWAASEQPLGGLGLEFRLVKARFTYDWTVEDAEFGEPVSFRDEENREFPWRPS